MSRHLPARPNLEFLKKEAKDHLDELRASDPRAQLADAQYRLARAYGFDSWPKLKSHVAALTADHPLAGRWIANLALSRRHAANPFRSATIDVRVEGSTVHFANEFVDDRGQPARSRLALDADGVARDTGHGYSVAATWIGPRELDTVARKDGDAIGGARYTVSPDGRRLTVADASGDSLIVLDKQTQ